MYLKHFLPHVLWTFLTSCTLNISYLICFELLSPHVLWTFLTSYAVNISHLMYFEHFHGSPVVAEDDFCMLQLLFNLSDIFPFWFLLFLPASSSSDSFFFFIQMVFEFDLALLFFENNNNNNKKTRWLGNSGPLCWESELWKVLSFTPGESQESFSCSVYCQEFHLSNFWLSDLFKFICA